MDLLQWANGRIAVVVTSQGKEEELSVIEYQRQAFTHHAWLLQHYADSADKGDFIKRTNFNGKNLETQLSGLQKYCTSGLPKKKAGNQLSELLFPFLDGVTVRPRPSLGHTAHPAHNFLNVKQLVDLGRTDRDALYGAFSARVKLEKTEAGMSKSIKSVFVVLTISSDAPRQTKKRKL